MDDLKHVRVTISLHIAVAIVVGWLSVVVSGFYGDWISILVGLIILWLTGKIASKVVNKDTKFWFSNGVFVYLLIWLISWIVFFNLIPGAA